MCPIRLAEAVGGGAGNSCAAHRSGDAHRMEKMGNRLLRLALAIHPQLDLSSLKQAVNSRQCAGSHPLVYGMLCFRLGISLERAAHGYLYTCVMTCVNSALRLLPMGQTEGQAIIARLLQSVVEAWRRRRCWSLRKPGRICRLQSWR